jgi:pullulanase/glycogen debranching enzyme
MGYSLVQDGAVFRVFSPLADSIEVVVYDKYNDQEGASYSCKLDSDGIWNVFVKNELKGKWYVYKVTRGDTVQFTADPWSTFVTSINHHLQFHKTKIIPPSDFNWEDDNFIQIEDPRDLIIYETHIKDMVAHSSARTYVQGIYNDFKEAEVGGISHLKRLGVNAVEFLPLQKFAYFEPPFNENTDEGIRNTWNSYARNYWGYMTSFFHAPETIYSSNADLRKGKVVGEKESAINELKSLVKSLHKNGIAVIMDVVYNHASHYDQNPLKILAKEHYFKLDHKGHYINNSWTGNDIDTSSHQSRSLIVQSVLHWIKEYHIDGFRFDLAGIIDWETIDLIKQEAQKINPNVILIAEPWGGEYKPAGFSDHGWISWNDKIRNGIKGSHPISDKGFIFGGWNHETSRFAMENFIRGTLKHGEKGLFNSSKHSLNYIESHDGYTLGDFIRISLDHSKNELKFDNKRALTNLNEQEANISKLAALTLFVSQGVTMIHCGQEWARTKLIFDQKNKDPKAGMLDHDSYNKDNETNWLNFNEIEINKSLFTYYQDLIQLRLHSPALRKAKPSDIHFKVYDDPLHVTFSIQTSLELDPYEYFISLNGNPKSDHEITLPKGSWELVVDKNSTTLNKTTITIENSYTLPPSSGVILRRLRIM